MASAASHDDDNDTNSSYTEDDDEDDEMAQTTNMQQDKGSTIATPSGGANSSSSASGNNAAFVQLFKESSSPKPTSLASLPPTSLAAAARALHPGAAARASVVPSHLNPFSAAVATGTTAVGSPHLSGAFSSLPFLQPTMAAAAAAAANHHPALADLALMQQRMAMDEQVRLRYMAQMALMASRVGDARGNFFGLGMMQQQQQQQQQQQSVALQQQQQVAALHQQQQQQVTALQQKRRLLEAQQVLQHHQQQQQQQKQRQEQAQPARKRRKLSSQMPHKTSLSIRQHTSRSKQSSSFPLPPLPSQTRTASTPTRQVPVITSLQAHHDLWNRLIAVAAKSKVISSASAKAQHDFVSNQFAKALEHPIKFQPKFANVKHTKNDNDAKPRSKKPDDRDDDSESYDDENEDYSDDDETS